LRANFADQPQRRFDRCLATLLKKERIYRQQPTFLYFPQLPTIEFYERDEFPWLAGIEAATDDIRAELVNVLADGPTTLEPYVSHGDGMPLDQWRELNNSRRWGVYFLWKAGTPIVEHIARCPRTVKALVFDDSIVREVWNDSDVPRAVLIFDIWSPYLSPAERALVSAVTTGVGEYYGAQARESPN